MSKITIELSFDDIVNNLFADADRDDYGDVIPPRTFSEEVRATIISNVTYEIKKMISEDAVKVAAKMAAEEARKFIDEKLREIVNERLLTGTFEVRRGFSESLDQIIEERINRLDPARIVSNHIDVKAEIFGKEMKARYDNVFAAKIVQSLKQNNMLSHEVAKILLGE